MAKSEECNELLGALALAQGEGMAAIKEATGQVGAQKTKYADLASCWDACRAPLAKHGLSVVQIPRSDGPKITVHTILGHKSGQWIDGELCMTSGDASPRGMGSAITYARRYALCAMVGIAPEDDDGEAASRGTKEAQKQVAETKIAGLKKARVPRAVEAAMGVSECDIIDAQTEEPPTELERTLEKSIEQAQASKDPEPDKFFALGRFADLKINIIAETGNDQLYYQGLAEAGYKKSNQIPAADMRRAYRCVAGAFTSWKKQQAPIEEGE